MWVGTRQSLVRFMIIELRSKSPSRKSTRKVSACLNLLVLPTLIRSHPYFATLYHTSENPDKRHDILTKIYTSWVRYTLSN